MDPCRAGHVKALCDRAARVAQEELRKEREGLHANIQHLVIRAAGLLREVERVRDDIRRSTRQRLLSFLVVPAVLIAGGFGCLRRHG